MNDEAARQGRPANQTNAASDDSSAGGLVSGFADLVALLEARGSVAGRRQGRNVRLRCPVHQPDEHPSLDVAEAADGSPLVICRVCGAKLEQVCAALGVDWRDYLPEGAVNGRVPDPFDTWCPGGQRAVAVYLYIDAEGRLVQRVSRTAEKQFPQSWPDPTSKSGWRWRKPDGFEPVLYHLDEVARAVNHDNETVYLCEGEKDADAIRQHGACGTCNPGGAGKWWPSLTRQLASTGEVVMTADNDKAGLEHALLVWKNVESEVGELGIVLPAVGKDVSDHLAAGKTLDELIPVSVDELPARVEQLAQRDDQPERDGVDRGLLRDDIGNAARFAREHAGGLVHVESFAPPWRYYDGRRFAPDETGVHVERAKETIDRLWRYADEAGSDSEEWRKFASLSRRADRLRAMLRLAASDPLLARRASDFDRDPWLLNVVNGSVVLRTGELRHHDPADRLTMLAGGAYRPDAEAPVWQQFLATIQPDEEVAAYLRRLAGYAAIGTVREHILAVLFGQGANGKGTFVNACRLALGDYAHAADVSLLLGATRPGAASPEIADLRGRRLVTVAESREDGRLNAERVKALTGGDPVTGRHLHANPMTFLPSHTCWLQTNHKPRVDDDGDAIWRRLVLVPFTVTIPKHEQDRDLPVRLAAEVDGILSWIVRGAIEYLERGLDEPDSVLAATAAYRDAESMFQAWVDERLTLGLGWTSCADLLADYTDWARDNGAEELTSRAIGERLALREGCQPSKSRGARGWSVLLRPKGED